MTPLPPVTPERIVSICKDFGIESEVCTTDTGCRVTTLHEEHFACYFSNEDRATSADHHFRSFMIGCNCGTQEGDEDTLIHFTNKFNRETRFGKAYVIREGNVLACPIEMICLCIDGASDETLTEYIAIFHAIKTNHAKSLVELTMVQQRN